MKNLLYFILLISFSVSFAQTENPRIQTIKNQLTILSTETAGLTEDVKTEFNVNNITLSNFLLAISKVHKVNINVAPELNQITIVNNFTNVPVADVLVFLCKEYDLTIDFTGNILSFKPYLEQPKIPETRIVPIAYNPNSNAISIDARGDKLYDVFKRIMDETGKNLVFSPGLENRLLTAYIQDTPFNAAMDKLAFANNLYVEQSKDGFFVFEDNTPVTVSNPDNRTVTPQTQPPVRRRNSNFYFKIKDAERQLLEVDFQNTPIADIINDIGNELNIDVFTATPLDEAGAATFKARNITFDALLNNLFEIQSVSGNPGGPNSPNQNQRISPTGGSKRFNFKKEGNIYFFGTEDQLSIRKVAIVHMQHSSVELLSDPQGGSNRRTAGRNFGNAGLNVRTPFNNTSINSNRNREQLNTNPNQNFNNFNNKAE
ncbi:MAG: hypothetical protein AAF901_09885, partial [Bacteroidota bacterium]